MVGLREIWALFRRRFWLIVSVVVACTLLATAASLTITKIYTATSTVVLERKDVRPFETDIATQTQERDRSAAETEMDVLRSRQFVGRIVDRLNLVRDAEFNIFAADGQATVSIKGIVDALLKNLGFGSKGKPESQLPTAEAQRDRAISTLLSKISVSRTGESLAVNVAVSSQRPDVAAKIANTMATLYVESSLEFKQDVRLADKQRARTTGGAVAFLRERVAQPLLITLRSEEARLSRERAELASRYGKNHPKIVDADSQIESVRKMIDDEVQRILQDLEIEALKPSARIVSLAEIPTSPSFPKPFFIIPAAFAASGLMAVLLALLLEATNTRIYNGERTSRILQVPNLGYVPRTRAAKKKARAAGNSHREANFERHQSLADEALRTIYLASRASGRGKQLSILMVTACLHDTASASTAWGIAVAGAADGRKVIYADLDAPPAKTAGAPAVGQVSTFLKSELSLSALMSEATKVPGKGNLTDATRELGELCRVLNSKSLRDVLMALRRIGYDFIVLNAPPVLAVSDADWLSPLVDGVILTVAWSKTTEEQLIDAASQLRLNHARLIGTVIDGVNPRTQANHGYGGALKYYREARAYMEKQA